MEVVHQSRSRPVKGKGLGHSVWDAEGVLLVDFLEGQRMIASANKSLRESYSEL